MKKTITLLLVTITWLAEYCQAATTTIDSIPYAQVTPSGFKIYGRTFSTGACFVRPWVSTDSLFMFAFQLPWVQRSGPIDTASFNVTGLNQGTAYWTKFEVQDSGSAVSNYSSVWHVTTRWIIVAPTITLVSITSVTTNSFTINGSGNSGNDSTFWRRAIIGLDASFTFSSFTSYVNQGFGSSSFSINATGLSPGTPYWIKLEGINGVDTVYSNVLQQTTQGTSVSINASEILLSAVGLSQTSIAISGAWLSNAD